MTIRLMEPGDILAVSRLVVDSFTHSVAVHLSEEGIATFMAVATPEAFATRMMEDNLFFVWECDGVARGVLELKEGRHVALLFVEPAAQRCADFRRIETLPGPVADGERLVDIRRCIHEIRF